MSLQRVDVEEIEVVIEMQGSRKITFKKSLKSEGFERISYGLGSQECCGSGGVHKLPA